MHEPPLDFLIGPLGRQTLGLGDLSIGFGNLAVGLLLRATNNLSGLLTSLLLCLRLEAFDVRSRLPGVGTSRLGRGRKVAFSAETCSALV